MNRSLAISILVTGSEVLDGRVVDTNSNYVAGLLTERGLVLHRVTTVTDSLAEITAGLEFLAKSSDIILVSGGLGPTTDDCTREAIATFCGVPLEQRAELITTLTEFFAARGREVNQNNLRQTYVPAGSEIIPNHKGTAPGFAIDYKNNGRSTKICAVPGVPSEMRAMITDWLIPLVIRLVGSDSRQERRALRLLGIPESEVGQIVESLQLPAEIEVSYRTSFPENQLTIKSWGNAALLDQCYQRLLDSFGAGPCFSTDLNVGMEEVVHRLLLQKKVTIGLAESCTGGRISASLTSQPGASEYLHGAVVAYSNDVKVHQLGVRPESIRKFGAVSVEVAEEMAIGARRLFKTDLALSVTGVAGPDGGTAEKPVGTFFIALATHSGVSSEHFFYSSSRFRVQQFATAQGLNRIRMAMIEMV